jgi:hypothetical protein
VSGADAPDAQTLLSHADVAPSPARHSRPRRVHTRS